MNPYVIDLKSKAALQESIAGGKGASLAWLIRNGFNVPAGFVVTSFALQDFVLTFGQTLTRKKDWTRQDREQTRRLFEACTLSSKLEHEISDKYRKIGGRVAVRSSMIGEDTESNSFAGQLDTQLNVEGGEQVARAVKRCWASLFNWRLFRYLNEREGVLPESILQNFSMAVVVQQMVIAHAAGIAFSADPISGQRCIIIEGARGLGDVVAHGLVKPDRWVIDARGILIESSLAEFNNPVLTERQVMQLGDIVRKIASLARFSQDIEWAWDGKTFHLLQSRPITSLSGKTVYSNKLVAEMVPGLVKPLIWSTNITAITRTTLARFFSELTGKRNIDPTLMIKRIHSRVYANITFFGSLFESAGLPGNLFDMISRDERAILRKDLMTLKRMPGVWRLFQFAWRHARIVPELHAFVARHTQALAHYRQMQWTHASPTELIDSADALLRIHADAQWYVFISAMSMNMRNRLLNRFVARRVTHIIPSDLIRGLIGSKALEPNEELQRLAKNAKCLPLPLQRLLLDGDDLVIRATLSKSTDGKALVQSIDTFLERFGFLSANGTDYSLAPWSENPLPIWRAIGRNAINPSHIAMEESITTREQTRKQVRSRLNWVQRPIFDALLKSTITYIDLRERISLLFSEDLHHLRCIYLAQADRFIGQEILLNREDIFYLEDSEIRRLINGDLYAKDAQELVCKRRAEMEADIDLILPDTICGEYNPSPYITQANKLDYLVGISASSGTIDGIARIVLDPLKAPVTLCRNDILVVPFTDVGWTPLLSGIGGIVAETGGQLSHTAIIAREYGIPAVVSVKGAIHIVKDGQPITVDGSQGKVYLR